MFFNFLNFNFFIIPLIFIFKMYYYPEKNKTLFLQQRSYVYFL